MPRAETRNEFARAKWIWAEDNTRKNDGVGFTRELVLPRLPKRAVLKIGVETKYRKGERVVVSIRNPFDRVRRRLNLKEWL